MIPGFCQSVAWLRCAKTAKGIDVFFGVATLKGPQIPHGKERKIRCGHCQLTLLLILVLDNIILVGVLGYNCGLRTAVRTEEVGE